VHRHRLTDKDVTTHWGIRTTTAARTPTDLAHTLDPASLTRAVNDAPRQPQINTIVAGYDVDAYWPAHRLVAELDGEAFHENFEAGLRVVRVTWDRLTTQPKREAARFRRLLV